MSAKLLFNMYNLICMMTNNTCIKCFKGVICLNNEAPKGLLSIYTGYIYGLYIRVIYKGYIYTGYIYKLYIRVIYTGYIQGILGTIYTEYTTELYLLYIRYILSTCGTAPLSNAMVMRFARNQVS